MFPRLAAAVLTLNLAGLLVSLWCILFGPWCEAGFVLGTSGFFLSIGALAVGQSKRGTQLFGPSWQGLAQEVPAFRGFRRPMGILTAMQMFMIIVAVIMLVCAASGYGVTDQYPVFQGRERYVIHSHGRQSEVSRLRYVTVGASFFVGWLGMAALPSLLSLHYVLFGRLPGWLEKRLANRQR